MDDWPFADAPNTLVFTTQPVLDGAAVRGVHRDESGDWQVLCVTTLAEEDARLVHFAHVVDLAPELLALADLPRGWSAGQCDDPDHVGWHRTPTTLRGRVRGWLRRA